LDWLPIAGARRLNTNRLDHRLRTIDQPLVEVGAKVVLADSQNDDAEDGEDDTEDQQVQRSEPKPQRPEVLPHIRSIIRRPGG
jgi:hypothetical protein